MMSPMEFYSSITPDCTTLHGVGSAAHVKVTQEEIDSGKVINRLYNSGIEKIQYCLPSPILLNPVMKG